MYLIGKNGHQSQLKENNNHNLPSTLTSMSSTLPATLLTVKKDVLPTAADDNDGPLTRIWWGESPCTRAKNGEPASQIEYTEISYHFILNFPTEGVLNHFWLRNHAAFCRTLSSVSPPFPFHIHTAPSKESIQNSSSTLLS